MRPPRQTAAPPIVTLLTDFGQQDGYVGAMQGVILSICPAATIAHLTHQIPPQNIQAAAFVLYQVFNCYPAHTVHCVVVDPGVGSKRRAVAIRTSHGLFVGPDNGVFSLILQAGEVNIYEAVTLTNPEYQLAGPSATFHGRDIFAPAAAWLAQGVALSRLGPSAINLKRLETLPRKADSQPDTARVIHVDRFGNLILNITQPEIDAAERVSFIAGGQTIHGLSRTFADVPEKALLAYTGSTRGHIEIAIRNGNAAQFLGLVPGDEVIIKRGASDSPATGK